MRKSTSAATNSTPRYAYPPEMAQAFAELAQANVRLTAQQEITARKVDALTASTNALTESTKRMGEQLGGIANNQGSVTEEFFYNSLLAHPQIGPFKFMDIIHNLEIGRKGKTQEFDLVLVNGTSVVVVEVKYKLHPSHIDKLSEQLKAFKKLSLNFKGYKVYGALAGFAVPRDVLAQAEERGYMVLQRKGQVITSHLQGLRAQ